MRSQFFLKKTILYTLVQHAQDAIMVLDTKHKVLYINAQFQNTFPRSTSQSSHKRRPTRVHYTEYIASPPFDALLHALLESTLSIKKDLISINDEMFSITAQKIDKKGILLFTFHNSTEVVQAQKIKKDFVTNASHELQTPLTSMRGYLDLLTQEQDPTRIQEYITILMRNNQRIINITDNLLTLATLEAVSEGSIAPLNMATENLMEIIHEVHTLFKIPLQEKQLSFTIESPEQPPYVFANRTQLEEVFINLVDNAIKYTEQGGITISVTTNTEYVHINIHDTGIGIPSDLHTRIFERFFVVDTTRSKQKGGTGLGLAIVKHIVHIHKGEIKVANGVHNTDKGTTFTLIFPIAPLPI